MKRIYWIAAAATLAVVGPLALLVVLIPRATLKTRIGEQIAAWTGREVSLRGEPEIDFFPELSVTLKDVTVAGPPGMRNAEILKMERLKGTVRLLPLIIGRVEIGSFTMVRPLVKLVRNDLGARNWAFESGAAALQLAFAGDVPLGTFTLEDGTLVYENRQRRVTEQLDSLNVTVLWPSVRQSVAVSGSGIWRGEQVTFSAGLADPFPFLNGEATAFDARLDAAPIAIGFSGQARDPETPELTGSLSVSTQSLRGFAGWLGSPIGPGSTLGPASIAGAAVFRDGTLSVEEAEIELDGNRAQGALAILVAKKPKIDGTLAFETLDLSPYLAGSPATGDWRRTAFGTDWFRDVAADIRLSAGSVKAGALELGATAASVSVSDTRLEIGLADAAFMDGTVAGDLAVLAQPGAPTPSVAAKLRATDFDLAHAAPAFGLPPGISGRATMALDVAGEGRNLGALVEALSGTARIDLSNGAFPLFGIAEIGVAGAGADPQQIGIGVTTPVRSLFAGFSVSRGVAILERASVSALAFSAEAKGWIGLLDGSLGLNGTVVPTGGGPVPFTIGGTLAAPQARPLALAN